MTVCNHRWRVSKDWMGDPSIPNGTVSWTVWNCRDCGEETTEQPDDYEDPDELNADAERDRRIDNALTSRDGGVEGWKPEQSHD